MESELIKNLWSFYEEDPNDPFNTYALALEYKKFNEEKAIFFFNKLLNEYPDYLPTYYAAAEFFAAIEAHEQVEKIYQDGIALALAKKQLKTHQELVRARNMWLDDLD
jgi:tetratricopeptide (TPR) repeat protein